MRKGTCVVTTRADQMRSTFLNLNSIHQPKRITNCSNFWPNIQNCFDQKTKLWIYITSQPVLVTQPRPASHQTSSFAPIRVNDVTVCYRTVVCWCICANSSLQSSPESLQSMDKFTPSWWFRRHRNGISDPLLVESYPCKYWFRPRYYKCSDFYQAALDPKANLAKR